MDDTVADRLRVLVVEDDPGYQRLLEISINRLGCHCDCCSDGKTALDCVASHPYDLIFIDIHIPELDGFMVACQLRESGYALPLIAISALKLEGIERKAKAVGYNDFLQKPIEDHQIEQLVNRYATKDGAKH